MPAPWWWASPWLIIPAMKLLALLTALLEIGKMECVKLIVVISPSII
tara:strand:+ start:208 stop:348 length:141 start_codon:yes stop_codon:yes gene_type:complete